MKNPITEAIIEHVYDQVDDATDQTFAFVSEGLKRLDSPDTHQIVSDLEMAISAHIAACIEHAFRIGYTAGRNPDTLILLD